ncbi:hypothetical protein ACCS95_36560, partial [Rhizobium ruizarguesonis]
QAGSSSGTFDRRNVKEIVIKNASDPKLDADYPAKGVKIARRNTPKTETLNAVCVLALPKPANLTPQLFNTSANLRTSLRSVQYGWQ